MHCHEGFWVCAVQIAIWFSARPRTFGVRKFIAALTYFGVRCVPAPL